jgi:hypothetical protein
MPAPQNLRAAGERIEQLLDELRETADRRSYDRAEELLRLVSDLYGAGLARVVELAEERSPDLIDVGARVAPRVVGPAGGRSTGPGATAAGCPWR